MKPATASKLAREGVEALPDLSLQKLWDDASVYFKEKTGEDLKGRLTFGEHIEEQTNSLRAINAPKNDGIVKSEVKESFFHKISSRATWERAREIFANVFRVIWRFSEFFIPALEKIPIAGAGVSFLQKAIELLIKTTQDYRSIFIKAAELFEQVGFFSMRFEMLMEAEKDGVTIHRKFIYFLNKIMACTVECVALYIALTKKDRGWKSATKQFFNTMANDDDAGVGEKLDELQGLIRQEGTLSTALILSSVLRIHKDVVAVQGSVTSISDKLTVVQEMISEQKSTLAPGRIQQLKDLFQIPQESWNITFLGCAESCILGTGAWLQEHPKFQSWVNGKMESPALAIEAGPSYGKTYLTTTMITHLLQQPKETATSRAIAFYYVDKSSKDIAAGAITQAIAYQLCIQNPRFHAIASPKIIEAFGESQQLTGSYAEKLWYILVDVSHQLKDFTCLVVLDGMELLAQESLKALSKILAASYQHMATGNFRVFLTGNAKTLDFMDRIFSQGAALSIPRINLDNDFAGNSPYLNESDLHLVATAELMQCEFFAEGLDTPDMIKSMNTVRELLVKTVRGDYFLLRSHALNIRNLLSLGEIESTISGSGDDRTAIIKRQLSSLAMRMSSGDIQRLRDTLHLLSVMEFLSPSMPHITVVDQYLRSGKDAAASRTKIQSAYSGLVATDPQGRLSLATHEISTYLLIDLEGTSKVTNAPQTPQDKQLEAIRHFLTATFNPSVLKDQGMDEDFFASRTRLSGLSNFVIERNLAMANVAIRLVVCLTTIYSEGQRGSSVQEFLELTALARAVLPAIFMEIETPQLDDAIRHRLAEETARLFLDEALLNALWPVEILPQITETWGRDQRYFDAASNIMQHARVRQRFPPTHAWIKALNEITDSSQLKLAVSKLIARGWLLSERFWSYAEIKAYFFWFTTIPSLGLLPETTKETGEYDELRQLGWYSLYNWRLIEAWVETDGDFVQNNFYDIQRAAVHCSFGCQNNVAVDLLDQHCATDWLANVWHAEAISWLEKMAAAFAAVEHSLELMEARNVDTAQMHKVNAFFLMCMGEWRNQTSNLAVRQKMIEINDRKPGAFSPYMLADSVLVALRTNVEVEGLKFFRDQHDAHNSAILDTFARQSSHTHIHMHIALGLLCVRDPDNSRTQSLLQTYQSSLALCGTNPSVSPQETNLARRRLNFWLGRLYFITIGDSNLSKAIDHWEVAVNDFLAKPARQDLELVLPIATHLCSAYMQKVLSEPFSKEADSIVVKLERLHKVASFSEDPKTLKLRFRVSLCLARLYIVRSESNKAQKILQDHAVSAFAMLSQRRNEPLFSIGWLYLASILTILSQDHGRILWAWSKVELHQRRGWWSSKSYYPRWVPDGDDPALEPTVQEKIESIKASEEYAFYDGNQINHVGVDSPDNYYLPSYATMGCDGRNCNAGGEGPVSDFCKPLHLAADLDFEGGWTIAQSRGRGERIPFRVCRDCMLSKLCSNCYTRLEKGTLPPTGCKPDHSAILIPGSDDEDFPYDVSEEDMKIVAEESKNWKIEFDWGRDPDWETGSSEGSGSDPDSSGSEQDDEAEADADAEAEVDI